MIMFSSFIVFSVNLIKVTTSSILTNGIHFKILSHSQCAVERGFSVNKELLVENLKEVSLLAQRIVYEQLTATKQDVHTFKISNDLIKSCKAARSKYMLHLDEKREQAVGNKKAEKQKLLNEEINDIKRERSALNRV